MMKTIFNIISLIVYIVASVLTHITVTSTMVDPSIFMIIFSRITLQIIITGFVTFLYLIVLVIIEADEEVIQPLLKDEKDEDSYN